MDDNAEAIKNALEALTERYSALPVKPFEGYSQDAADWLHDYEQAAGRQGWTPQQKLARVRPYLRGEGIEWYREHDEFERWEPEEGHLNRNEAFRTAFLDRFRTRGKILQWHLELDQLVQKATDTVDQYARQLRRLLRRVDPNNEMTEPMRIHTFVRGLRPTIQVQMINYLTCRDNVTLGDTVAAAEQFEKGQLTHLHQIASNTPPVAANLIAAAQPAVDPMEQLAKKLEQMLQPMANAISNLSQQVTQVQQRRNQPMMQQAQPGVPQQTANNQWRQRQQRGPITCHRCGQPGHIARVCPNGLATQLPVQQPQVNTLQQPVLAAAQDVPQYNQMQPALSPRGYRDTTMPTRQYQQAPQETVDNTQVPPHRPPAPRHVSFCLDDDQTLEESLNWYAHP
jgi:hypothetical protein